MGTILHFCCPEPVTCLLLRHSRPSWESSCPTWGLLSIAWFLSDWLVFRIFSIKALSVSGKFVCSCSGLFAQKTKNSSGSCALASFCVEWRVYLSCYKLDTRSPCRRPGLLIVASRVTRTSKLEGIAGSYSYGKRNRQDLLELLCQLFCNQSQSCSITRRDG